jgi:hypothetical protein
METKSSVPYLKEPILVRTLTPYLSGIYFVVIRLRLEIAVHLFPLTTDLKNTCAISEIVLLLYRCIFSLLNTEYTVTYKITHSNLPGVIL